MLRGAIQLAAILFLLAAIVGVAIRPDAWPMLWMAGVIVLGTLYERFHYRGSAKAADRRGGWSQTQERFRDEESGALVTVWFNAATGERRYVEPGEAPPGRRIAIANELQR